MATISKLTSGRFRAQIRRKGFPEIHQIFNTELEAKAWASEVEARLLGKAFEAKPVSTTLLRDVWLIYKESNTHKDKSPGSQKREEQAWVAVDRLIGNVPVSALSEYAIQVQFFDPRARENNARGQRISGNTIRIERDLLRQIFKYAKRRRIVDDNPVKGGDFDLPKCKMREGRINREVEQRLYDVGFDHLSSGLDWDEFDKTGGGDNPNDNMSGYNWLRYMFQTGSRPGEASRIKLSWISSDFTRIHVPAEYHKPRVPRVVLTDQISMSLQGWYENAKKKGSEYLFYSYTTERELRHFDYSAFWRRVAPKAKLEKGITPHIIRHEFISRLFEETDFSDTKIAAIVGDTNTASLRPYVHLRAAALAPDLKVHNQQEILRRHDEVKKRKQKK